jgi:hypothetical protein
MSKRQIEEIEDDKERKVDEPLSKKRKVDEFVSKKRKEEFEKCENYIKLLLKAKKRIFINKLC